MAFGSILIFEIPICREYQITLDCYTIGMFKSLKKPMKRLAHQNQPSYSVPYGISKPLLLNTGLI